MIEHFHSRWLVQDAQEITPRALLAVGQQGRVSGASKENGETQGNVTDLGDVVIVPGYVNAHAHLELPDLGQSGSGEFVPWVGRVLKRRAQLGIADYSAQVESGAKRALATGTTALGEVNSSGCGEAFLAQFPLRTRLYRELLDGDDGERTPEQRRRLALPFLEDLAGGLAPHAPHTVSDVLLEACARECRARSLPLSIHWAETPEERDWLSRAVGPFAPFFKRSPSCSGLQRLARAGILDLPLTLVHGNHPEPGDLEELLRCGVGLVHCPGTHAYFDRPQAQLEKWAELGLSVALGTDSLASNGDLDMGREMSLLRAQHPGLDPATVLEWATRGGARALSLHNEIGDLAVGKWADFSAVDAAGMESEADVLEALTGARPEVLGVWIAGRQVWTKQ